MMRRFNYVYIDCVLFFFYYLDLVDDQGSKLPDTRARVSGMRVPDPDFRNLSLPGSNLDPMIFLCPTKKIDKIIPLKSQIIILMIERQICILVQKSYVFILNPADFYL